MGHIQHLSFEILVKMDHFQKEPPLNLKGTTEAKGSEIRVRRNVRFGSKADMCNAPAHVRFAPDSDRKSRHAANSHVRFTPESGRVQRATTNVR